MHGVIPVLGCMRVFLQSDSVSWWEHLAIGTNARTAGPETWACAGLHTSIVGGNMVLVGHTNQDNNLPLVRSEALATAHIATSASLSDTSRNALSGSVSIGFRPLFIVKLPFCKYCARKYLHSSPSRLACHFLQPIDASQSLETLLKRLKLLLL